MSVSSPSSCSDNEEHKAGIGIHKYSQIFANGNPFKNDMLNMKLKHSQKQIHSMKSTGKIHTTDTSESEQDDVDNLKRKHVSRRVVPSKGRKFVTRESTSDSSSSEKEAKKIPLLVKKVFNKNDSSEDTESDSVASGEEDYSTKNMTNKANNLVKEKRKSESTKKSYSADVQINGSFSKKEKTLKVKKEVNPSEDEEIDHKSIRVNKNNELTNKKVANKSKARTPKGNKVSVPVKVPRPIKSNDSFSENDSLENSFQKDTRSVVIIKKEELSDHPSSEDGEEPQVPHPLLIKRGSSSSSTDSDSSTKSDIARSTLNKSKSPNNRLSTSRDTTLNDSQKSKINVLQQVIFSPGPKSKNWHETFREHYPQTEKISFGSDSLTSDSEEIVGMLRLPKTVEPRLLENLKCHLNKETIFNIGGKIHDYIIKPLTVKPEPVLLIGHQLQLLNLQTTYIMEKCLRNNEEPDITIPESTVVPLPNNLKTRHPLFGIKYKKKIKLKEAIEQKLDEAVAKLKEQEEKDRRKAMKKRKKAKKIKKQEQTEDELIFNILSSHSSSKELKSDVKHSDWNKNKVIGSRTVGIKEEADSDVINSGKSPKKKRKDSVINTNLNGVNIYHAAETETESSTSNMSTKKKKKKKYDMMDEDIGTTKTKSKLNIILNSHSSGMENKESYKKKRNRDSHKDEMNIVSKKIKKEK